MNFPPPPNYKDEVDRNYGDDWSNIPRTAEQVQEWKRVYYAMVANLDHNVGRIIRCLKENDIEKETIFVFSSDHGERFGAHGRMKKNIFYDEAARIPLLIRYPEKICNNTISDACISNIDFMQTILGMAGIESPEEAEGMDLSECALTGGGPQPDFAFLQNTGACAAWEDGHEWRAVRTKEYTYAVYKVDGKELLFNNRKDPYQMKNLAEDSMFLELKDDLRKKMETKMELIKDDFNISSWYRDNWISEDRKILKTAVSS